MQVAMIYFYSYTQDLIFLSKAILPSQSLSNA